MEVPPIYLIVTFVNDFSNDQPLVKPIEYRGSIHIGQVFLPRLRTEVAHGGRTFSVPSLYVALPAPISVKNRMRSLCDNPMHLKKMPESEFVFYNRAVSMHSSTSCLEFECAKLSLSLRAAGPMFYGFGSPKKGASAEKSVRRDVPL